MLLNCSAMNLSDLSAAQLRRAAALKERIEKLHKKLAGILGSASPAPAAGDGGRKKHKRSAAARARMAAAQKARWAKIKGTTKSAPAAITVPVDIAAPVAKPARKKWKLSAAGKARIKAANQAYWAKIKAAQKP